VSGETAQHLIDYVKRGGHLVLGQRSLMKDEDNSLWPQRQPGPLVDLIGGRVEQWYALENPVPVAGDWGSSDSRLWAELLSTRSPETQVLMKYGKSNGWLDGQPAAITRQVGKGRITYVGAWLDPAAMHNAARWMLNDSGVTPALGPELPEGVEASVRYGPKSKVVILVNCSKTPQNITLPSAMTDVLNGGQKTSVALERYGVAVLSQP
jgi:beta-galactosidase